MQILSHVFPSSHSTLYNSSLLKSVSPISFSRLPTLETQISRTGHLSKSNFNPNLMVSPIRKIFRLNKSAAMGETNAILGDGSSDSACNSAFASFESTVNKLSKWLVAGLFGIVIIWKHDAEILWAAMGSVVNSLLSITLKRILNHERPSALRSDPGMPSSHAQSIFYASAFALLSMIHWLGLNVLSVVLGTGILACGSYLSWLRVSQQFHTTNQVLVGAILGFCMGVAWFWLWHSIVLNAFITFVWVRIIVVLGSISFCAAFVVYVIRHWLNNEL